MLKLKIGGKNYRTRGITGAIATILSIPALVVMLVAIAVIFVLVIPAVGIGMIGAQQVANDD